MTTDPTMRIVWFAGRAYPVSSHPLGPEDRGTHWHVQTPDGEWHAFMRRDLGDGEGDAWRAVVAAAEAWLADHATGG